MLRIHLGSPHVVHGNNFYQLLFYPAFILFKAVCGEGVQVWDISPDAVFLVGCDEGHTSVCDVMGRGTHEVRCAHRQASPGASRSVVLTGFLSRRGHTYFCLGVDAVNNLVTFAVCRASPPLSPPDHPVSPRLFPDP